MSKKQKTSSVYTNRFRKRAVTALLAACVLLSAFTGCTDGSESSSETQASGQTVQTQSSTAQPQSSEAQEDPDSASQQAYYTFEDSLGNEVVVPQKPERVVSLMGSYAETWMLAGGELVGVTDDVVTERGMEVSEDTQIVGTQHSPNLEAILAVSPDFVLLSADVDEHVQLAATLEQAGIPHAFFEVEHFEEYLNMLKICTDLTGRADLYEENGLQVQQQIDEVLAKIPQQEEKPTVLFLRAMTTKAKAQSGDNMTCKMLEDLGTVNIAAQDPSLLEDLSMEKIMVDDPDYIFAVPMGDTEKSIQALKDNLESNPAWSSLSAVQNGQYVVLPKDLFHYKPNARWGESYEYLAKILYPDLFE